MKRSIKVLSFVFILMIGSNEAMLMETLFNLKEK